MPSSISTRKSEGGRWTSAVGPRSASAVLVAWPDRRCWRGGGRDALRTAGGTPALHSEVRGLRPEIRRPRSDARSPAVRSIISFAPWTCLRALCVSDCRQPALLPRTRLARAACYLLGLDLLLFALQRLFGLFKVSCGLALSGWIGILSFLAIILLLPCSPIRWLKAKVLWRLRNRLIVTYMFIGVIPVVLLVAMASHHHLFVRRPVRKLRRDLGTGFPAAQPAIGKCRHCQ